jgi:hypothetical protein
LRHIGALARHSSAVDRCCAFDGRADHSGRIGRDWRNSREASSNIRSHSLKCAPSSGAAHAICLRRSCTVRFSSRCACAASEGSERG